MQEMKMCPHKVLHKNTAASFTGDNPNTHSSKSNKLNSGDSCNETLPDSKMKQTNECARKNMNEINGNYPKIQKLDTKEYMLQGYMF
jgi:hypothetical protein